MNLVMSKETRERHFAGTTAGQETELGNKAGAGIGGGFMIYGRFNKAGYGGAPKRNAPFRRLHPGLLHRCKTLRHGLPTMRDLRHAPANARQ